MTLFLVALLGFACAWMVFSCDREIRELRNRLGVAAITNAQRLRSCNMRIESLRADIIDLQNRLIELRALVQYYD